MHPSNTPHECCVRAENESCRLESLLSNGINVLQGEEYLLLFKRDRLADAYKLHFKKINDIAVNYEAIITLFEKLSLHYCYLFISQH